MKRAHFIFFISVIFASCAKIPVESVTLMNGISKEGERMHKMNIALLSNLLDNKKQAISDHVKEFQSSLIAHITESIPQGTNMNDPKELEGFFSGTRSYVNRYEDSLVTILQKGYDEMASKLNTEYLAFQEACTAIKNILNSSIKVDKARSELAQKLVSLTGAKTDVKRFEELIDQYLLKGGDAIERGDAFYRHLKEFLGN